MLTLWRNAFHSNAVRPTVALHAAQHSDVPSNVLLTTQVARCSGPHREHVFHQPHHLYRYLLRATQHRYTT